MKKELSEVDKKRLLRRNHHQKIDYALAKAFVNDSDVYRLVKDFFAEYLDLKYEFTHEELTSELNKKFIEEALKKQIVHFLARLSYLQYNTSEHPSQEQLKDMIKEFKDIISKLIVFEEQKNTGIVGKIKNWLTGIRAKRDEEEKKPLEDHQTDPSQEESISVINTPQEQPVSVQMLVQEVEQSLRANNVMDARNKYKQLISMYNALPEPEKRQIYQKMSDLYTMLKG